MGGTFGRLAKNVKTDRELLEEAMGWILRLEESSQDSPAFKEFDAWREGAEENRTAWERVNKTWTVLGAVKPAYNQKVWGDIAPASKPSAALAPTFSAHLVRRRKSYGRPVAAAVAALAAAYVLWITIPAILISMRADYRTAAGQVERVRMADGSTVDLGGGSAIKAHIGTAQRRVTLLAGEAFFDVASDAARPFIVDVEGIEVTVLGTAFDIRVSSASTSVALLRGSVEAVSPTKDKPPAVLKPGEMLVVEHATGKTSIEPISLDDIGAWRQGKVFLANATVGSAIELIQRYHSAWISIPDRGLANRRVSGLFDLRDPDRALIALVEPFGGKVRSITPLARVVTRL